MSEYLDLCLETGSNTQKIREFSEFAEELGIGVIGVCEDYDKIKDFENFLDTVDEVNKDVGPRVVSSVKVSAENLKDLNDKISAAREMFHVVIVQGGDTDINRRASEDSRVDILLSPGKGRKDAGIDQVVSREMKENNVALGICWRDLLKTSGKKRSQVLSKIRRQKSFSDKYGFDMVLVSGAEKKYEMRKPRDTAGLACMLGFEVGEAKKTVKENQSGIVERAEKVMSDRYVIPGVEVVDDES